MISTRAQGRIAPLGKVARFCTSALLLGVWATLAAPSLPAWCASSAPVPPQARAALVIGIPHYPALPGAPLRGVMNDVTRMAGFFEGAGYKLSRLYGEAATYEAIESALASMESQGGDVAVYFSGRGSLKGASRENMEPTLVPYDGLRESADKDIPMSRLEKLARAVEGRGGSFLLILDCSFQRPPVSAKDLYNHYDKENIRTLGRPGRARSKLFEGPGVVLAACHPQGGAYEWRLLLDQEQGEVWFGAFTHSLTGQLAEYVFTLKAASYRDLMYDVSAPILERESGGYMPGFQPYPSGEALASAPPEYAKPVAILVNPVSGIGPPAPVVEARREKAQLESEFRVAFEIDDSITGEAREGLAARIHAEAKSTLEQAIPGLKVAERFSAKPDRVVTVAVTQGGGMVATVSGEPVDDPSQKPEFRGNNFAGLADAGLREYLETTANVYALARMADAEKGTADFRLTFEAAKTTYAPDEPVLLAIRSRSPGLLYLIDTNQADGIVHLVAAGLDHPNDPGRATQTRYPSNVQLQFTGPQKAGRLLVWCILAVPGQGVSLPKVDGGKPAAANLAAHLRALREGLKAGNVHWQAARIELLIVK